jgi:hypothetical protein
VEVCIDVETSRTTLAIKGILTVGSRRSEVPSLPGCGGWVRENDPNPETQCYTEEVKVLTETESLPNMRFAAMASAIFVSSTAVDRECLNFPNKASGLIMAGRRISSQ